MSHTAPINPFPGGSATHSPAELSRFFWNGTLNDESSKFFDTMMPDIINHHHLLQCSSSSVLDQFSHCPGVNNPLVFDRACSLSALDDAQSLDGFKLASSLFDASPTCTPLINKETGQSCNRYETSFEKELEELLGDHSNNFTEPEMNTHDDGIHHNKIKKPARRSSLSIHDKSSNREEDDDVYADESDAECGKSTPSSSAPRLACNNKLAIDSKWLHLVDLSVPEVNEYIRDHKLTSADATAIKKARRRAKNRMYSATARSKRKSRRTPGASALVRQLWAVQKELQSEMAVLAKLEAQCKYLGVLPRTWCSTEDVD